MEHNKECGIETGKDFSKKAKIYYEEPEKISRISDNDDRNYIENYIKQKELYSLKSYMENFQYKIC